MHERLGVLGEIEVHDMTDVGDVDAARCEVGRDERGNAAATESLEHALAFVLANIAVECARRAAEALERLHELVRAVLRAPEHERSYDVVAAQDLV